MPNSSFLTFILMRTVITDMERLMLHKLLALPQDRPYFRRASAYLFPADIPASAPLLNVHEGLTPTGERR